MASADTDIVAVLQHPTSQDLLANSIARLAYVAPDGTPRVVPIGFLWNGSTVVMCTSTNAPKVRSLGADPHVALTIDTIEFPPKILLLRGTVELDTVDGIPAEYLAMNSDQMMVPEQRQAWEVEVRSLYKQMVRIVMTPTWAKLIDFEGTLPTAVEELVRERDEREQREAGE
ncbi:pyridoxamine 5'-phosphate oxidase family protein [Nocardiopsis sp. HNM0947]|uniref:Pyridoxamine 5'-phosphate oxidase family protein n=1 Tax=Nocardiopsis coralli TaxID=2772213 RepID=A0ABR9PDU5_9ACTN|nr:pyridoxamine 5'-phosphate oxidase family protein [Nocardiopsis coralli]MBE3001982.1 pyridoxamine 5'-phosphate oxidase family protein [Nocardiopsis coralli]